MIHGRAKCEFGTGDILITPMCKCDLSKGMICLQNKGTHNIGEYSSSDDFCKEEDDTLLTFTKAESIDVLIERLEYLKGMMLGEIEDIKTYKYDY